MVYQTGYSPDALQGLGAEPKWGLFTNHQPDKVPAPSGDRDLTGVSRNKLPLLAQCGQTAGMAVVAVAVSTPEVC